MKGLALSLVRFTAATPIIFAPARAPPYRGALAQLAVAGLLGVADSSCKDVGVGSLLVCGGLD